MQLPFVLSPYLRPIKTADGFAVDDGIRGTFELDAPGQAVVRALWEPEKASIELGKVNARFGPHAVQAALERLTSDGLVFESRDACDRFVDTVLEAERSEVPFLDQIELTNICPFRCQFCPRGVPGKITRPLGKMSLALFEKLLDQVHPHQAAYRPLELHHLGESLVHEDVHRFIAAATQRGLPTEMSCNPSLLKPEIGRNILDAGIKRLVLSLDGVDDETLISIRGPAARYDKAEKNLDALLGYASTLATAPTIVIQMIDLYRNRHQREAFLARWGGTGHAFVRAYVKNLDGPDPDTGVASATPNDYMCSYPWRSVAVLWDGRVVPCCRDADAKLVLGDLNTQTLAEIWNGATIRRLREQLRAKEVPCGHLCDGCSWRRERYAQLSATRHPDLAKDEPLHW